MKRNTLLLSFLVFCFTHSYARFSFPISLLDTTHEETPIFFEGFQKFKLKEGWNFKGKDGNLLSTTNYDEVRNFVNGYAAVQKNEKWGLIDQKGEEVVSCLYELVLTQKTGKILVLLNDRWSLLTIRSKQLKSLDIDRIIQFDGKYWLFEKAGKTGYLSDSGELVYTGNKQPSAQQVASMQSGSGGNILNRATPSNPCPANLDFELGRFTNWNCFVGKVDTVGNVNRITVSPSAPTNNRHVVYSRSTAANFVDPYGLFSRNPPDGSRFAVRLGNTSYNAQAERIRYTIRVPNNDSNFSIKYDYAVVFEDPDHTAWSQPRFEARLFDSATNSYVGCASFEYIASSNLPGFAVSTVDPGVVYKPWASVFMSMRGYEGKTMYLEFTTADCARGRHWGYAYVDVQSVCGQPLYIGYDCQTPYTVTLDAPPGFQTYNWWNHDFTQILATGEHSSISPGPDTTTRIWLEMLPFQSFGCNDTLALTISGAFEPTFYLSSRQTYCAPQTIQFYNTNAGAVSVTWELGDGTTLTGDTITHVYTQPGTYVVKMMVIMPNGCTGVKTDTIHIYQPTGTLTYNGGSFCNNPNIQFQVISNGAQSYVWDFGDGTTEQGSIPTASHQYTINGNYQPTVTLNYGNGCNLLLTGQQNIFIDSAIASFTDQLIPDCGKAVLKLNNSSAQNTSVNWAVNNNTFIGNQVQTILTSEGSLMIRQLVSSISGCKDTIDRLITVDFFDFPSGIIHGPATVCPGEVAVIKSVFPLSDSIQTYKWILNGNLIATTDTLNWIGNVAGNYAFICIATNKNGCSDTIQHIMLVKPKPSLVQKVNQNLCAGSNTASINFISTPNGATVNWTNSLTSIGLTATGSGNIASFASVNNSSSTQTAIITATPSLDGCVGDAITMNIAVKPIPVLNAFSNQNLCAGANTTAINFASTPNNASINWTNSLPSIGLAATGSGNIASFASVNNSSSTQTAIITATPSLDGCVGDAITMNIAVKPIPVLNAVVNQNLCAGENTTAINFASTPSNANINWTNSLPSIGLAATGSGNIASFASVNNSSSTQTATITATPSLDGCVGNAVTMNIAVKPIPVLNAVVNQNLCAGENTTAINFISTPNGATVNWTNSLTSIGLAATGSGNIASFASVNNSSSTQTAIITATPSLDGCVGDVITMNIAVKPIPVLSAIANQNLCAGSNTTAINFASTPNNASINWTNSLPSIGLTATGSGNIASFAAVNASSTTQTATITATPSLDGCVGDAITMNIAIKPIPVLNALSNQNLCAGANTTAINFISTPNGATINWTNSLTSIGLSATGNGNITSFAAVNNSSSTQTATITATPSLDGCVGDTITMNIAVKPIPALSAIANQNLCAGSNTAAINFISTPIGATVNWTNSLPSIGLAATGSGNITSFASVNNSSSTQTATITATPSLDGCVGDVITMNIAVKPIPVLSAIANQNLCASANATAINFVSTPSNANINWTNSLTSIGLATNGSGNIASFAAVNNSSSTQTASITATPSLDGCVGDAVTMQISVQPRLEFNVPSPISVCSGSRIDSILLQSNVLGTHFTWTNDRADLGLFASGNGTIPSFIASSTSNQPQRIQIRVVGSTNLCPAVVKTINIQIDPKPVLDPITDQVVCADVRTIELRLRSSIDAAQIRWTNNNPAIGLSAQGIGDLPAFTAINNQQAPISATINLLAVANLCTSDSITFRIVVNPRIELDSIFDLQSCQGLWIPTIQFNTNIPETQISWTNNNPSIGMLPSGVGDIPRFLAINTGRETQTAEIQVVAVSPFGCPPAEKQFRIDVGATPSLIAQSTLNVCRGNVAQLSAQGAVRYNWTPSTPLTCPTCSATDARIQDTTDFIVEGFNAMGCRKKDTVRVNVIQPFQLKVAPGDTVCQGKAVQLLAEKAATYQWYPTTGLSASNIANPIATPNTNTRYMVIGKDANNCFSDTGYVNLVIAPTPLVNAGPDVQAPTGTQVQLNASVQSTQAVSWNWTPSAGLSCTACPNPKATITANKTYVVSVQNASGCMSKDTLNVISFCKGAEIFVANAFTPDGDGVNDVLVVRGVGITVRSFKVFNRWGNLVFEKRMIRANDYKNGWDGRVKGVLAAPDVYVYTVEVVCDNGEVFFHKGNTTLLK